MTLRGNFLPKYRAKLNPQQQYTSNGRGFFDITEDDFKKGISWVKYKTKKKFKIKAKILHPDTGRHLHSRCNGYSFPRMLRSYRNIMDMEIVPTTIENFDSVMEIQKGYKTTEDFPEIFK
jgi:hypothetical protein